MIGLSLLSSVSKHNMWSYYECVVVFRQVTQYVVVLWLGCRRFSVNTICVRIMIGLSLLSSVSKHNMWSYYDWVVVVVVRQLTQYVVVLWLGCRSCHPSVNTICGRIMIGLSLSFVSKHNMWSYYDWVVVVVVRQLIQYVIVLCFGLLSSVSKHNMWSYYDWIVVVVRH